MAGSGRKVFTAGDVLTASDVQNYLQDQAVMNFATSAARSSAIATPTTGMTTYIGTTGTATIPQIETYTGSAWQTPYGATLVANATFSATTTLSVNNVFTSTYSNYLINFDGLDQSVATDVFLRLRVGGTDVTAANYAYGVNQRSFTAATLTTTAQTNTGTQFQLGSTFTSSTGSAMINLFRPQVNARTVYRAFGVAAGDVSLETTGYYKANTQVDGFTIYAASGTLAGTIRVYGYRNS